MANAPEWQPDGKIVKSKKQPICDEDGKEDDWFEPRWTIAAFDDGSGMWLTEWRNYRTFRTHNDDGTVSPWSDSIKDCNSTWQLEHSYVQSDMAKAIMACWKHSKKRKKHRRRERGGNE